MDGCGYSVSTYIDHEIEYFSRDEIVSTNTNTYYHIVGQCKKCGSKSCMDLNGNRTGEDCYDSEGNRISCANRKVCVGCGYDYTKL